MNSRNRNHKNLTDKQALVINCVLDYFQENGIVPTHEELAVDAGLPSKQAAYSHIAKLVNRHDYFIPVLRLSSKTLGAVKAGYKLGPKSKEMLRYSERIEVAGYRRKK